MITKRKLAPLVALVVASVVTPLALSSAAGAATSVRTWTVEGTLNVGIVSIPFPPGSTFTATYDSSSGALTNGTLSVPTYSTTWLGVPLAVTLSDGGNATGTLASNGAATVNESVTATVDSGFIGAPCVVGPIAIAANTNSAGGGVDFHGNPSTGTLTDDGLGFDVPVALASGACTQQMADSLNSALPLPSSGNVTVTLTQTSDVPTTPTTTPTTAPTVPATATQTDQLATTGSSSGALLVGSLILFSVGCAFVWKGRTQPRSD
jgi:hypothetical protein